ncbi:hypothetical protein [Noviherbaspirillum sp. ST9]|uniref:hypothetical protein n=1 Tax=Noviherbaspirillum sp. ST9 TaxID=3401606 RepID=UPI003B58A1D0
MSSRPSAGAAVGLVVLVATSLTFETTGFSILSVNPAPALLLLMVTPDVSLERWLEVFFDAVAPLAVFGAAPLAAAALVAAGTIFAVPALSVSGFTAGFTLLFTVVLPCLAMAFIDEEAVLAAGFRAFATVFATFPATAFSIDLVAGLAAVLPLAGSTVFAAVLLTLFADAFLVADLVTVAFMVPSLL